MKYKVRVTGNRHFELTDELGNACGRLDFDAPCATFAHVDLPDGTQYKFWQVNDYRNPNIVEMVTDNEQVICSLSENWKGQIVAALSDGRTYRLRLAGLRDYKMMDAEGAILLSIRSDFNLAQFTWSYVGAVNYNPTDLPDNVLFLLNVYCIKLRLHLKA
jgi:hypothetical protein